MSREAGPGALSMKKLCALFEVSRQAVYAAWKRPEPAVRRVPAGRRGVPAHQLLAEIRSVVSKHPAWGHRKVWATVRRKGISVVHPRPGQVGPGWPGF